MKLLLLLAFPACLVAQTHTDTVVAHHQRIDTTTVDTVRITRVDTVTLRAPVPVVTPPPSVTPPASVGLAELPRAVPSVAWPTLSGRVLRVAASDNLQHVLDSARAGDQVLLAAGATWTGNFTLPARGDSGWVVVMSDGVLPVAGTRVLLSDSTRMARLRTPNASPALATRPAANGWRLVGLDIGATPSTTMSYGLVALGDGAAATQTTLAQVPTQLILDRVYVHGHSTLDVRRCVAVNSAWTAVVDSHLSECHSNQGDSQALYGWNGPGPFLYANNYLEAGHEIAGFGGPSVGIPQLVPSDITVRGNHFARPMAWKGVWRVKNFWECKSCQRVLIEGNVMENNWVDGQNGFAILLQGLSDNNNAPWNRIADVTLRNNVIRNTPSGINLASRLAYGGPVPVTPGSRITITNNLVSLDATLSGAGRALQLLSDLTDVAVVGNTFTDTSGTALVSMVQFDAAVGLGPTVRLVLSGNVFGAARYPVMGNGTVGALTTLAKYGPDAVVTGNLFTAAPAVLFPPGNTFAPGAVVVGADATRLWFLLAGVVRE